jgi:hypothetical protein
MIYRSDRRPNGRRPKLSEGDVAWIDARWNVRRGARVRKLPISAMSRILKVSPGTIADAALRRNAYAEVPR